MRGLGGSVVDCIVAKRPGFPWIVPEIVLLSRRRNQWFEVGKYGLIGGAGFLSGCFLISTSLMIRCVEPSAWSGTISSMPRTPLKEIKRNLKALLISPLDISL